MLPLVGIAAIIIAIAFVIFGTLKKGKRERMGEHDRRH